MNILEKAYTMSMNPPNRFDEDKYYEEVRKEYLRIIDEEYEENVYQYFFERNPSFMPGSHEVIGNSNSHWPIQNALISQPILTNNNKIRKPDFMWLAKNSLCFCPVLIEIEKPSKSEFRKDSDIARTQFTQAVGQIKQWKALLSSDEAKKDFYERYNVTEEYRKLKFTPQYVLVFGRRKEYEGNTWLTSVRAEEECADTRIISFDRLATPDRNAYDCVTCKVSNGRYTVINIPPTFVFKPSTIQAIGGYTYNDFEKAVDKMEYTSEERKKFLKERYQYWREVFPKLRHGVINTSDKE